MAAKPPHMPVKEALTIKVKITASGEGQLCSFPGAHRLDAINLGFSVAVHSFSTYHVEEAGQQEEKQGQQTDIELKGERENPEDV